MSNTLELVFVPMPVMGHLLSTVELAKLMILRDHRICITIHIMNSPIQAAKTNVYIDSQSRDNPYPTRLTFHTLPPLSNPLDLSSPTLFDNNIEAHKPLVKQAVEDRIRAGSPKPAGFVLDMFCTTMVNVANELHIPSYIFFTSGANMLNLMFHVQSLVDDHAIDTVTMFNEPDTEFAMPGFRNKLSAKVIPTIFQGTSPWSDIYMKSARGLRKAKGVLVNTYVELETYAIQALLDGMGDKDRNLPAIYPVGPILELDSASRDDGSQKEKNESMMRWLDDQPESSVVFLCFGSMGSFDAEQVKEIAEGLDRSGHRFLWSLRTPPTQGQATASQDVFLEALPEGFLNHTSSKGKIIGWAPQVSILGHPAVGGFVSHCGWNSTLESLWFGVPVGTWPLFADQQLNAYELVKELGLAVEVRIDYKGNIVLTAEDIENGVKKLMSMDKEMRERVKEMSGEGRKALHDGGSSYYWLGRFIEDVSHNVV